MGLVEFRVNMKSEALRMLKTVASSKTTGIATKVGTASAFALMKKHYAGRWRAFTKNTAPSVSEETGEPLNWSAMKSLFGFPIEPGFLSGTTFRSITYSTRGSRGNVFLKPVKWPQPNITEDTIETGLGPAAMGEWDAYDKAVKGPEPPVLSEQEMREMLRDLGFIGGQSVEIQAKGGRMGDNWMALSPQGLSYGFRGRKFMISPEILSKKKFGTSRGGMFQSAGESTKGGKRSLAVRNKIRKPKKTTPPFDFMYFGDRGNDIKRVMEVLSNFYGRVLMRGKATSYKPGAG